MTAKANSDQREYWNGADSREWVEHPDRFDEMLGPFGELLLERAAPDVGSRVLDLGCGSGALTLEAARLVGDDGHALGVDLSTAMIENARRRATQAGATNVRFEVADAQVGDLGGPHDLALSRFGIMFFADPVAAFANVASSLTVGARLQVVCWAPALDNDWVAVPMGAMLEVLGAPSGELPPPDQPGPFRYADPGPLLDTLEQAGFVDAAAERVDTALLLGGRGSMEHVLGFLAGSGMFRALLGDVAPDVRADVLASVEGALTPYRVDDGVRIGAAVWLVSARRR